ncbi:unnamed protein product [Tenebrio molitor]|nr:unnamed protein product [Tenebrio molitor]
MKSLLSNFCLPNESFILHDIVVRRLRSTNSRKGTPGVNVNGSVYYHLTTITGNTPGWFKKTL